MPLRARREHVATYLATQILLEFGGQEPLRAVAIVQAGGVEANAEDQPVGVHEHVALTAE